MIRAIVSNDDNTHHHHAYTALIHSIVDNNYRNTSRESINSRRAFECKNVQILNDFQRLNQSNKLRITIQQPATTYQMISKFSIEKERANEETSDLPSKCNQILMRIVNSMAASTSKFLYQPFTNANNNHDCNNIKYIPMYYI